MKCTLCPDLVKSRRRICEGEVFYSVPVDHPQIMAIAEAPGVEEDTLGRPMMGNSGQDARHHLTINGMAGKGVYLTNMCLCHPPGNRDPSPSEISNCVLNHLTPTILGMQPKWIITMGRISTRFFLGNVDMEMVHGVPYTVDFYGLQIAILPTYHPAAGLHSPEQAINFLTDMRTAGDVVRGKIEAHPPRDEWKGKERYELVAH